MSLSQEHNLKIHAFINGIQRVPRIITQAKGDLIAKANHEEFKYQLHLENIENVVEASLNLGIRGHNGPQVALLFSPDEPTGPVNGFIVDGTLTKDDLIGNLTGAPLDVLLNEIVHGHVYVTIKVEESNTDLIRGQLTPLKIAPKPDDSSSSSEEECHKKKHSCHKKKHHKCRGYHRGF